MSFKLSASSWHIKTGNPIAKLVLMALSSFANDEGCCWPSERTLAVMCETSERTIRRCVRSLQQSGHIRVKVSLGRKSNIYTLTRTDCPGCNHSTRTISPITEDTVSGLTRTISPPILSVQPVIEQGGGKRPLSSAELIHLERERDRQEVVVKRLRAQDFRTAEDIALLKKSKARIAAIDAATHIPL